MKRLFATGTLVASLALLSVGLVGCSDETQREASEAAGATGEALESAADDAANVVDGAIDGADDAVEENKDKVDDGTN